jgi:hypothetical protein
MVSEFPLDELETVFKGRPHLAALWEKLARGETEFTPKEQIQITLAKARVYELRGEFGRMIELARDAQTRANKSSTPMESPTHL